MKKSDLIQLAKLSKLSPKKIKAKSNALHKKLNEAASTKMKEVISTRLKDASTEVKTAFTNIEFKPEVLGRESVSTVISSKVDLSALSEEKKKIVVADIEKIESVGTLENLVQTELPIALNPVFQKDIELGKFYQISELASISEDKANAILEKDFDIKAIKDDELESLVKKNVITKKEAKKLGLASNLTTLFDGHIEMTETLNKKFDVDSFEDLVNLDKDHWLEVVKDSKVDLAGDVAKEDYSLLLYKKVERLFPERSLILNRTEVKTNDVEKDIKSVKSLFKNNPNAFTSQNFEELDLEDISASNAKKMRASYENVRAVINKYPGFGLIEIANDTTKAPATRAKHITESIALVDKFYENNKNVKFLSLDYKHDSDDVKKLDFTGLNKKEQAQVMSTVKSYQRVQTFTNDIEHTDQILSAGYHSAFHITSGTLNQFVQNTKLDPTVASVYFDNAYQTIVKTTGIMGSILDVLTDSFTWTNVGNIGPSIKDYLKDIPGYDDLFGTMAFCECDHCSSIYSPAAYFVDMMQFVQKYILDKHFKGDKKNHVLNLKVRRPDLWTLPLTCENTSTLIPYLDIINEILESYIAKKKGFTGDLSDKAALETFVYKNEIAFERPGNWRARIKSFEQPFHLPLCSVDTYLTHFDTTREDINILFQEDQEKIAQAAFGLSDKEYAIMTEEDERPSILKAIYGIAFTVQSNKIKPFDAQELLKSMRVSRSELDALVNTNFITKDGAFKITIVGEKISSESVQNDIERIKSLTFTALDRMHRFVRLWRKTDWTIQELDLIFDHLSKSGITNKLDDKALIHIAQLKRIKSSLDLSVEEVCAVWNAIPIKVMQEDVPSFFDSLFNHKDDVDLLGAYPMPGTDFIHAAHAIDNSTDPAEFSAARLMSGLAVSESELLGLIENLADSLGVSNLGSATESDRGFKLNLDNLSLLYRHAKIAKQLSVSVSDLFQICKLIPELANNIVEDLDQLITLIDFHNWHEESGFSLEDLHFMIESPDLIDATAYADPTVITEALVEEIRSSQALYFADTVFAYFDDVTEEQSKAIIEANSGVITIAAEGGLYQLKADFDPSSAITVPAGITRAENELRDVLRLYHPEYLIPFQLSSAIDLSETNTSQLIEALGIDLDADSFANELSNENLDPDSIEELVEKLLPLQIAFRDKKFDTDVLDFVLNNLARFEIADLDKLTLEDIKRLIAFVQYVSIDDAGVSNITELSELISGFTIANQYAEVDQDKLSALYAIDKSTLSTIHHAIPDSQNAIDALEALQNFVDVSELMGLSADSLNKIISNDYETLNEAVGILLSAFRIKYRSEEERNEKLEPYQDKLRSKRRAALSTYLIRSGFPQFQNENDLFYYFLIDTELEGCARTSRLVAATMSLQLYLHRILLNLEQDDKEPGTANRVNLMVDPDDPGNLDYQVFPLDEWEWRKNYRVWEANRKVFLYPENYIEPDLRDNKSPLFEELEQELLQEEINTDTVLEAYGKYMRGFDEVAHLKIAGSYLQRDDETETDVLHLFGVSVDDPIRYYYRTVENLYYSEKNQSRGVVWHPWEEIKVQVPVRKVAPIIYNGRLFLFWARVTTLSNTLFDENRSIFTGYSHKVEIEFSTLKLDKTWSPIQKVNLKNMYPFSGNGVIQDPLAENAEREEFMDALMTHFPFFDFTSINAAIRDLRTPRYDTEPHHGPIDEYTLDGFMWDRLYPSVDCNNRLILTGAGYQMQSTLDFYNLKSKQAGVRAVSGRETISITPREQSKIYHKLGNGLYKGTAPTSLYFPQYAHSELMVNTDRSHPMIQRHWGEGTIDLSFPSAYISGNKLANLREGSTVQTTNGALGDAIIDVEGDLLYIKGTSLPGDNFSLLRLGTTLSETLTRTLFTSGVDTMLSIATQKALKEMAAPISLTNSFVTNNVVSGKIDYTGPYGVYYREIFFHIPFLLANHLNSQGRYAEAQKWYHYIFNPTNNEQIDLSDPGLSAEEKKKLDLDRNWQYLEFRNLDIDSLRAQLNDTTAIEAYKKNPFNPHAIARLRLSAYQKSIVMKYVDNLLDWGDHLFSKDTMESINEATLLYIIAKEIMGETPAQLGDCGEGKITPKTYEKILPALNSGSEFLAEMESYIFVPPKYTPKFQSPSIAFASNTIEAVSATVRRDLTYNVGVAAVSQPQATVALDQLIVTNGDIVKPTKLGLEYGVPAMTNKAPDDKFTGKFAAGTNRTTRWNKFAPYVNMKFLVPSFGISFIRQISPVFCIPGNKDLLGYFDRVNDRLFKIRNCMNIDGQKRQLALFAPAIDPRLLVKGAAAGLSLDDILNSISGNLPPYRFEYILEKAKAFTSVVQSFGSALLGAMEKRDVEELSLLRMTQQVNMLEMASKTRDLEIDSAVKSIESITQRIASLNYQIGHYTGLIDTDLNGWERAQQVSKHIASGLNVAAGVVDTVAGIAFLVPQIGSPFAMKYGGQELGNSANAWAMVLKDAALVGNSIAGSMGLEASFERRREGWKHQRSILEYQLEQAGKSLIIAEIRRDILLEAKEIHVQNIANMDEMLSFYGEKFTNLGLFTWLSSSMQQLYKEAFNNAMAIARLAEQAYKFERDDSNIFVQGNNFDSSKAGLLAGDKLLMSLQMMERKFLETNYRNHEIDQAFSLTQIDPNALLSLKQTGDCTFEIPELFFDMFYPGQYNRKIKAVRLSIPSVTGPYVNVSASLSLNSSFIRSNAKLDAAELKEVPKSRTTTIATSTAQNDAGVFQLNFRDDRYMPFEGAGAISSWKLSLPKNFRQFDYNTINDVIIHISYTADYDELFKDNVEELNAATSGTIAHTLKNNSLFRTFSLRQEFSNDFHRIINSPEDQEHLVAIENKHFPMFFTGKTIKVQSAKMLLHVPDGQTVASVQIKVNSDSISGFSQDPNMSQIFTKDLGNALGAQLLASHKITVQDGGDLSPAPSGGIDPAFDSDKINDIILLIEYTVE